MPWDPCLTPLERPNLPGGRRIRVVEVLATGTNGGAQEHLFALVTRMDPTRYDVSVVALSAGSAVRKLQRAGVAVLVIDDPDDVIAVGALAAHLAEVRADVVHAHMYRAETVAARAIIALGEAGQRRPYLVATAHSSRVRSEADRATLLALTPTFDHLIAVSKASEQKLIDEGRSTVPVSLIYNGVDLQRYDHQEPCCTLPEEYGMEAGSQIVGVVARLEPEKGHPTLLEAWPGVLRAVPDAYLLIVGEGSRRDALEAEARAAADRPSGRVHRAPRRCSRGDGRARRGGPAVLSRGPGVDHPRGDGAVTPGRRVGRRRDPGDGRRRRHRPARPAARRRGLTAAIVRLLTDHPFADMLGRAGHDLVHDRFCIEQMVAAVESIYEEGARTVRPSEVSAAAG